MGMMRPGQQILPHARSAWRRRRASEGVRNTEEHLGFLKLMKHTEAARDLLQCPKLEAHMLTVLQSCRLDRASRAGADKCLVWMCYCQLPMHAMEVPVLSNLLEDKAHMNIVHE